MNLLDLRHVSVMRGERLVLDDVTVHIGFGENVAILGPNGCGKTTLLKLIDRELYPLRQPESSMRILGEERWNVDELRGCFGIVKNDLLPPAAGATSARELVVSSFFGSVGLWNRQQPTAPMWEAADAALASVEALHLAERYSDELSSGESRRVQIARALAHRPRTLLLDEPFNNLDPRAQAELRIILSRLAQAGTAIVMITHHAGDIIPEIERLILLRGGRLFAEGSKRDLLIGEFLSRLFDWPIQVTCRDGMYSAETLTNLGG